MRKIYKFPLKIEDKQTLSLQVGAEPLCVQNQNGTLTMWAAVDADAALEERTFNVIGTGNPIDGHEGVYIGTAQIGAFVWHVFEEPRND